MNKPIVDTLPKELDTLLTFFEDYHKLKPELLQGALWAINCEEIFELDNQIKAELMESYIQSAYDRHDMKLVSLLLFKKAKDSKKTE